MVGAQPGGTKQFSSPLLRVSFLGHVWAPWSAMLPGGHVCPSTQSNLAGRRVGLWVMSPNLDPWEQC